MKNQREHWNEIHADRKLYVYADNPTAFAVKVNKLIPAASSILELGCGAGNDGYYLAEQGHIVLSTDFSDSAIQQNKKRYPALQALTFETCDISKQFSFADHSFDVIYARLSLHYFDDVTTRQIFDELYRVLKVGGLLCFMCKSTNDRLYGQGERVGQDMFEHNGHVRHFFSKEYAKELLGGRYHVEKLYEGSGILYDEKSNFVEVIAKKE